jgi:hypothetical protein
LRKPAACPRRFAWTVEGNTDGGTAIDTNGLLFVAEGESAATLTVGVHHSGYR